MSSKQVFLDGDGPVILIDDDEDFLLIAAEAFSLSNVSNDVLQFQSGQDFLTYMDQVRKAHKPMPSIVLLDINMPDHNGFYYLQEIRNQEDFQDIPCIVMFSNSNAERDIKKALELGADGYYVKPMNFEDYIAFANSLLAN